VFRSRVNIDIGFGRWTLPENTGTLILQLVEDNGPKKDYESMLSTIQGIEGVISARVNYASLTIRIEFDPSKWTVETLHSEIGRKIYK
jgi:hypothetical protein